MKLALFFFFGFVLSQWVPQRISDQAQGQLAQSDLSAEEEQNIKIFERSAGAVVQISTSAVQRDFFSLNVMQVPRGTGTGFVWDEMGHVVTNFHVIQNADIAEVRFSDKKTWKAKLVGYAPEQDIAVLKIEATAEKLKPLPRGASEQLKVGQKVFAIGNPFGLDQTLTVGIISALGREIDSVAQTPIKDVIQTDAAINPGNSGGPLLDSQGRLIGVNTAIYSPSGASAGIGFAIPIDTVKWVVPELIKHGKIVKPGLGISIAPDRVAWQWDLEGVLILDIEKGSPAERAGLRKTRRLRGGGLELGDIIIAINNRPITKSADLSRELSTYRIGDAVEITVLRGQRRTKVSAKLGGY